MQEEIIFNIDVMLAKRKMSVTELADKVGITIANISILKNGKAMWIHPTMHRSVDGPLTKKVIGHNSISIPVIPWSRGILTKQLLFASVEHEKTPALTVAAKWWICLCWMVGMNGLNFWGWMVY